MVLASICELAAVRSFLQARAVINFVMRAARTSEITNGDQRALRKFSASWNLSLWKHCFAPSNLAVTPSKHYNRRKARQHVKILSRLNTSQQLTANYALFSIPFAARNYFPYLLKSQVGSFSRGLKIACLYKRNISGRVTLLPGTELRPVSFNKRQQNSIFPETFLVRACCPNIKKLGNIVSSVSFCFQDANYAYATRQGILTKIRACEQLQASTHLIFAAIWAKAKFCEHFQIGWDYSMPPTDGERCRS